MVSAHILFHVPEGLEFIAATDIASVIDLEGSELSHEPLTGHVHLTCQVESYAWLKNYLQHLPLHSIYSATLVVSVSLVPSSLLSMDTPDPLLEYIVTTTIQAPWQQVIQEDPNQSLSFRATFKKGSWKHKVPSQTFAGYIGSAFSSFFPSWKVKMTDYDYEIMAIWLSNLPGQSHDTLLLGFTLPMQDQTQRHRIHTGRTSLNPCIAYCLALLADPKPGQIILDMCCGTATIPIEGASRFKDVFWLGGEVKVETLTELALGNVHYCGLKNIDLMLSDGRKLCYRDESIDTVVSDWPWGLRENSYKQIQGLYPKFMKQMWRVLKPHGQVYIVTQGHKLMKRVLDYDWCKKLWHTEQILPFRIGGYDVNLYKLTKKL
ncbi:S-adenosyl-L-methionine-dependent methyltransferase [Blakeslea trispora]|nr:S-adenosyl-L-methionine-dependent methyltransferase [Blakeslea trispora]